MAEKMSAYIGEQKDRLMEILTERDAVLAGFEKACSGTRWKKILMVGSGSSYNAACCAKGLFAELCGTEAVPCVPTQLEPHLLTADRQDTLVLLISQSGASTSTIGILSSLRESGWKTAGLTQDLSSPLAAGCDPVTEIRCGEEMVGPKTKGYTCTVLTLQLMAVCLARAQGRWEEAERTLKKLKAAVSAIPEHIRRSRAWIGSVRETLIKAPHILLMGCGEACPMLQEGALKLLETLYIPCVSYDFEEYLHGVHCTIGPGSELILVLPDAPRRERMLRLAAFNEANGGHSLLISMKSDEAGSLVLEAENNFTSVYSALIPLQLIGAEVSAMKGINCDRPKFPEFARALNTKRMR